jgi:hypothetical protein
MIKYGKFKEGKETYFLIIIKQSIIAALLRQQLVTFETFFSSGCNEFYDNFTTQLTLKINLVF